MHIRPGSVDVTLYVKLVDAATGAPATGLTITDLDLQYTRNRTVPSAKADATALAGANAAHADGGMAEIDATYSPGLYRVDWPDAAFAAGAAQVALAITGAAIEPELMTVELRVNPLDEAGLYSEDAALPRGQLERIHALAGGTKMVKVAPEAGVNPTWVHRDQADSKDLITRTRSVGEATVGGVQVDDDTEVVEPT